MDLTEQGEHFLTELNALVSRFANEYDLPYSSVIGILEIKKLDLYNQLVDQLEEDDE